MFAFQTSFILVNHLCDPGDSPISSETFSPILASPVFLYLSCHLCSTNSLYLRHPPEMISFLFNGCCKYFNLNIQISVSCCTYLSESDYFLVVFLSQHNVSSFLNLP